MTFVKNGLAPHKQKTPANFYGGDKIEIYLSPIVFLFFFPIKRRSGYIRELCRVTHELVECAPSTAKE